MSYFDEVAQIAKALDPKELEDLVDAIANLGGRLFIAGLGGSAANASHAAADFRRLAGIEAYCLTDNVASFTAQANDDGWDSCLDLTHCRPNDALMVLSVGGGTNKVSRPLGVAMEYAMTHKMRVLGIVGRDGGFAKKFGDAVVVVPNLFPKRVTPHTESFQSVILHYLVSHPKIQKRKTKW